MTTEMQLRTTLTKSELISAYLQQMALPSMFNRVLSESDYEIWDTVLGSYSAAAIKFAFDNWITSGRRFPVPADIEPMCISHQEQEEQLRNPKPHRGEIPGGGKEILDLWVAVCDRRDLFLAEGKTPPRMTDRELDEFIADVRSGEIKPTGKGTTTHFANGNAIYRKEMVQARALLTV